MGFLEIKKRVGRIAPQWMVQLYRRAAIAYEFAMDYLSFAASTVWTPGSIRKDPRFDEAEAFESRVTLLYHGLEKGAAMPSPRRPFGLRKVEDIRILISRAEGRGVRLASSAVAQEAIEELSRYNAGGPVSDVLTPASSWDERRWAPEEVERFVRTRHSVRNFDPSRDVESEVVERIVALASTTPSVCNRRAYRAHYFDDRDLIDSILSLQNGNLGFGHTVPSLIVVSERRSAFIGPGERNQRWVDGGLFAMSLVWLFHAEGLGTCFLNWSETHSQTARLRKVAEIPQSEDVVVLIAIGHAMPGHRVARSPLRSCTDILVRH